MPPPPCTAGATAHVLLVLVAGICALQASASDYVKYDYLPFRAPGGCTELPIDYLKISLEEEVRRVPIMRLRPQRVLPFRTMCWNVLQCSLSTAHT